MGAKHARPAQCEFLEKPKFRGLGEKWTLYTMETLKKNLELAPFYALPIILGSVLSFICWHRTMRTTIDLQMDSYQRWEMPSKPRFFDLRNPRNMKLLNTHNWRPAYHLDNRYRLMRHEPMLDAAGNETDEIGEDETGWDVPQS